MKYLLAHSHKEFATVRVRDIMLVIVILNLDYSARHTSGNFNCKCFKPVQIFVVNT